MFRAFSFSLTRSLHTIIVSITALVLSIGLTSAQIIDITQHNVSLPEDVDAGRAIAGDMDGRSAGGIKDLLQGKMKESKKSLRIIGRKLDRIL